MRTLFFGIMIALVSLLSDVHGQEERSPQDAQLNAALFNVLMNANGVYESLSPQEQAIVQECAAQLTTLGLFGGMLGGDIMLRLPKFPKVVSFELAGTVYPLTLQQIPNLFPNLREFTCTYAAPLQEDSIGLLSGLANLQAITLTDLASNNPQTFCATDITCMVIGKQFPGLKALSVELFRINKNPITDKGVMALSPLQQLQSLVLIPTDISDAGLSAIAKAHPNLIVLSLSQDQNITDKGVEKLIKLRQLESLHLIDCNQLTVKSKAIITENLPDLRDVQITSSKIAS